MWKRNNLPITCAKETLLLENPDKPQQKRKLRKFCSNSKNSNVLVIGPSESGKPNIMSINESTLQSANLLLLLSYIKQT